MVLQSKYQKKQIHKIKMIKIQHARDLGRGLWYLPSVFDKKVFDQLKTQYRETSTDWELSYPHRLSSKYRNQKAYPYLWEVAENVRPQLIDFVGYELQPISQEIFIDLPGHKLSWHYDNDNFKVLLQVYMGEQLIQNGGTNWYLGDQNDELYQKYGANSIVPVAGLNKVETSFAPNAGYINDNTQKKAHGTNSVPAGVVRESLLFLFG